MFRILKLILNLEGIFNVIYNKLIFTIFKVNHEDFRINGRITIRGRGQIMIGSKFTANSGKLNNPIGGGSDLTLVCLQSGAIKIGNNVGISNSTLVCWESIIVEDNVLIGGGCKIWDTDFHSIDFNERIYNGDKNIKTNKILIRKNSFVGGGVTILKGVEIGENSIIAAGSVVTKKVPNNQIWGGNPAKFIKEL